MQCFPAAQQQQHSSSSTAAAAQQQWWWLRRVAVFGPSTPDQTRTPNEEDGTPKRDFFSGFSDYALRISMTDRPPRCIADRGTAEAAAQQQRHRSSSTGAAAQQQQHSSSDGSDVAATDEKDERGYTGELFVFVLALWRNLKRTSADTPRSLQLTTAVLLCR